MSKPKRFPFRMRVRLTRPNQEDFLRSFTVNAMHSADAIAIANAVGIILEKKLGPKRAKAMHMNVDFDTRVRTSPPEDFTLEEMIVWALTR